MHVPWLSNDRFKDHHVCSWLTIIRECSGRPSFNCFFSGPVSLLAVGKLSMMLWQIPKAPSEHFLSCKRPLVMSDWDCGSNKFPNCSYNIGWSCQLLLLTVWSETVARHAEPLQICQFSPGRSLFGDTLIASSILCWWNEPSAAYRGSYQYLTICPSSAQSDGPSLLYISVMEPSEKYLEPGGSYWQLSEWMHDIFAGTNPFAMTISMQCLHISRLCLFRTPLWIQYCCRFCFLILRLERYFIFSSQYTWSVRNWCLKKNTRKQ